MTSLPYLWFLVPVFVHTDLFWWIGEGMVIAIEASIMAFVLRLSAKDAFLASGICNLASLSLGQVMLRWLE